MGIWRPGEALTPKDRELIKPLIDAYDALGRTPKVCEIESSASVKARFRTWKRALQAAGLPAMNDPEQTRLRERERGL